MEFSAIFAVEIFKKRPKMPLKHTILLFFGLMAVAGCSNQQEPRQISRLDLALSQGHMTATDSAAFSAWADVIGFEGLPEEYAGRTAPFEALVIAAITDLDSVEQVLGETLAEHEQIKLTGVVSPYNQAVVTHPDGYVFIALNHYLGPKSAAYAGFPEFLRQRKITERMPVDIAMAIIASENEPQFEADASLLNHLLYQGALLVQAKNMLPEETPESTILGMTPEEYEWCEANEARIWKALIERKLLYSTDSEVISRLTRPSPASPLISADAPGQAALYCALKLAQAYEHKNGSPALPQPEYYNNRQTLIKSAYAPR